MVADLVTEAVHEPFLCEETFHLALTLFRKLAETSLGFLDLDDLAKQWGALLLSHTSREVKRPASSHAIMLTPNTGYRPSRKYRYDCARSHSSSTLCNILFKGFPAAFVLQVSLQCFLVLVLPLANIFLSAIGTKLFRKHLFPELSIDGDDDDDDLTLTATIPLLNTVTRQMMAETIFQLLKDDETQYREILTSLSTLVPYANIEDGMVPTKVSSATLTMFPGPYVYDLGFYFERSKSTRSSTGYVGLRNLSNTCYLNSLFTQLFMNIPFREFMLTAHIADGRDSQKLLAETQNLFSYMQNSFKRFVDPANLASSIRTYEDGQIDVSVQMDVDEFYNLLFDRWESQILAPDAKRKFRSFYGGQLVQQVKSKECSHISERLEPFSAIQCDIKGKTSLQESLQAYVDGEIMEGGMYWFRNVQPTYLRRFR
jgi:ubiquitin carboxyl-terminal hydrolase 34